MPSYKVNDAVYDEAPALAVAASKVLSEYYVKLGKPKTPFTDSGKKMMDMIIAVWEECYPLDAKTWYDQRREYQANEMSTREQVRFHTGRSLASYPLPIYNIMKKVFRGFDAAERKNCMRMVKLWPAFRMTNKA